MWTVSVEDLRVLKECRYFDPDWYVDRYPDVALVGIDPAEHYLRYGFRFGRDPGPEFPNRFYQTAFASVVGNFDPLTTLVKEEAHSGSVPAPDAGRVLRAAHLLFARGAHDQALALAGTYLTTPYLHTLNILKANYAQVKDNRSEWQDHVNAYFSHFGQNQIRLKQTPRDIFHDLSSPPLAVHNEGPLISILMPVYNAAQTVETAIRSILKQTWRNLELIAVDDQSNDASMDILTRLMAEDSRLTVRQLPINAGPYVAKNVALQHARGDWITCHDADDWAHPNRLAQHMNAAKSTLGGLPVSLTFMIRMQMDGYFDTIVNANPFSPDGATRIASVSALYEGQFLREKLGYWDTVRVGADSEMIARAEKVTGKETHRFQQLGMICLSTQQGLTRDPVLGIRPSGRLSDVRAAYKTSWSTIHDAIPADKLYLTFPQKMRRYQGDFGFDVSYRDILKVTGG